MEEIVQAVGISKGGMYHHFSNKEEIFLELLRDGDEYRKDIVQKSMRENLLSRRDKIVDILLERILDKNLRFFLFQNSKNACVVYNLISFLNMVKSELI